MSAQALFGISILLSFVAWWVVLARNVWPALRQRTRADALRPILMLHSFRFVGLSFLIPGVVSPQLPADFARPAAYGDLVTSILALLSLATLQRGWGIVVVWVFNFWGAIDLLNAYYQGNRTAVGLDPGLQGAAYFIPTALVPLLLLTHGLAFRILWRQR